MSADKNIVEQVFTVPGLAAHLDLDESTIWRLIKEGAFCTVYQLRARNTTRIPAHAVNRWLATRVVTPPLEAGA